MGVISLMGKEQAKLIESKLIGLLDPEEWAAHDVRCGDAADFQGSERDVIFLSMVKTAEPGRRVGASTADMYLQRYNVAASRAKDQMWLFHSLRIEDLGNTADMRHQLLDYVYGVINREHNDDHRVLRQTVSEDARVDPFDSLFEQRIFNRIHGRGYAVIPQYPAEGYNIDLVVVGAHGNLAIECDGDTWHGPAQYGADLARQRDLERCGWTFFRIRESAFYMDPDAALADLWPMLDALGTWQPKAAECAATLIEASTRAATSDEAISDGGDELELAGLDLLELAWKKDAPEPVPPDALDQLATLAVEVPAPTGAAALPRLASEEAWTEAELDEIVDDLRTMIERTTSLVSSLEREIAGPMRGTEREQRLTALKSESAKMLDLGAAIRKVGAGTFGLCERCSEPIGRLRLLARPHARHCLDCSGSRA